MPYPIPPPASCAIAWQPNALAPVFYGQRDYAQNQSGAPVPLRVFFPSIDGSPTSAAILAGCGRYPAIGFAHGHCIGDDKDHYKRWVHLPAQLARAGYVVVVPSLSYDKLPGKGSPAAGALSSVIEWLRQRWEHRQVLMPAGATGVVGHSFGGLAAADVASGNGNVAAYAALSADWTNWEGGSPGKSPLPILSLKQPKFLFEVDDLFPGLPEHQWAKLSQPKHRAVFKDGKHWDYLPANVSIPCRGPQDLGPCRHIAAATADLLTMFFGNYLPPELAPHLPAAIPNDLVPPKLNLTPAQKPFAGNYLVGMPALERDSKCSVTLTPKNPPGYASGSAQLGIGLGNI